VDIVEKRKPLFDKELLKDDLRCNYNIKDEVKKLLQYFKTII